MINQLKCLGFINCRLLILLVFILLKLNQPFKRVNLWKELKLKVRN